MGERTAETLLKPRVAVVADPDAGRLALAAAALASSGFSVHTASDGTGLSSQLELRTPDVVVLDSSLTDSFPGAGMPVLLMINPAQAFDFAEAEGWGVTDYIVGPGSADELVYRVAALIGRARERRRIRTSAEALRESLRNVSAAIRATNDPQQIADQLVNGFGQALRADRVWFSTFQDERVPKIRSQWNRPDLARIPARLGEYEERGALMAQRLWAEADVRATADHQAGPSSRFATEVEVWTGQPCPKSSVVVPVGEGESALGVIWIASVDEPRKWTRTEVSLVQHVAGNVAHGLIQGHLISAQQQVLQQLRQLDKAKTDFLATVNHELRTPLTSITAYLDMISDGVGGPVPEGIERMVEVIARNSDRLRHLIEDMLTVSQQEGAGSLNLRPVNIGLVLLTVVSALRPLSEARSITVTFEDSSNDVKIHADEAQLEQVFTNIVANAIKFTPDGGRIRIAIDPEVASNGSHSVRVRVLDTGVGIPEHEIPQVFTRFYRASNASSAAIPGSGLGLAIAHDIVRRHSGQLELESELGSGTTVSVHLPLAGP